MESTLPKELPARFRIPEGMVRKDLVIESDIRGMLPSNTKWTFQTSGIDSNYAVQELATFTPDMPDYSDLFIDICREEDGVSVRTSKANPYRVYVDNKKQSTSEGLVVSKKDLINFLTAVKDKDPRAFEKYNPYNRIHLRASACLDEIAEKLEAVDPRIALALDRVSDLLEGSSTSRSDRPLPLLTGALSDQEQIIADFLSDRKKHNAASLDAIKGASKEEILDMVNYVNDETGLIKEGLDSILKRINPTLTKIDRMRQNLKRRLEEKRIQS